MMTVPINIVDLVRAMESCPCAQRAAFGAEYEALLSKRPEAMKFRLSEYKSLRRFVSACASHGLADYDLDGFAYSFQIPRISKEFDLLRVTEGNVLDIELKSSKPMQGDIQEQLRRNEYYLKALDLPVTVLTYVVDSDEWLTLSNSDLIKTEWDEAVASIRGKAELRLSDYDELFNPSDYLISPIMNPDAFIGGRYFLTSQQEEIKNNVVRYLDEEGSGGLVVRGGAGTGKSLLLYDLAKAIAQKTKKHSAIIHGAKLSEQHVAFNKKQSDIVVLDPWNLGSIAAEEYSFIGFDESHRMYIDQFEKAIKEVQDAEVPFLVALDARQVMSKKEEQRDVDGVVNRLIRSECHYSLKNKFRTNADVVGFVEAFINGRKDVAFKPGCVNVVYARNRDDARKRINRFIDSGYQYINMSCSKLTRGSINAYEKQGFPSTHDVIGLEYEKVVMVVPDLIYLNQNGRISEKRHPNPDLMPLRLLYQGLTRAMDAVALVFVGDWEVFQYAVSILSK